MTIQVTVMKFRNEAFPTKGSFHQQLSITVIYMYINDDKQGIDLHS